MTQTKMPEPVAWRSKYKSEPGMIGNYPWSYVEHSLRQPALNNYDIESLITIDQAESYAAAKVQEAQQWISVDDRLPDAGVLVLVYSPPQPGDWPDSIRIEFDCIDPDSDDPIWLNHSEHYEHYSCVAKGGSGVEWIGPSASAPYTHWMPLPAPPQHDNE